MIKTILYYTHSNTLSQNFKTILEIQFEESLINLHNANPKLFNDSEEIAGFANDKIRCGCGIQKISIPLIYNKSFPDVGLILKGWTDQ